MTEARREGVTLTRGTWLGVRVLVAALLVVVVLLLVAVIAILVTQGNLPLCGSGLTIKPRDLENPGIFEDLTPDEMTAVRDYMLGITSLKLVRQENATPSDAYIYLIDLHLPLKDAAIKYLDGGHRQPDRTAKVTVYRGDADPPKVEEYLVGNLPRPSWQRLLAGQAYRRTPIPWTSRPVDSVEYVRLFALLDNVGGQLEPLLRESYGLTYANCSAPQPCMVFYDVAPRGVQSGERRTWFWAFRKLEGFYLHPLGLEILIDHVSRDPGTWRVIRAVYNGQAFYGVAELLRAFNSDPNLDKVKATPDPYEVRYSSYRRRGPSDQDLPGRGPRPVEPDGRRYGVDGQHVTYFGWSFNFRMRTSTGMQLFDVRFHGERIAYELSLQDAVVFYSGFGPVAGHTNYYDTSWMLGASSFELLPGLDCPHTAHFHTAYHFVDGGQPRRYRNTVCVFEHNAGLPLRRHYTNDFSGSYDYMAGLLDNALIVRSVLNIWNYDYIMDYIFHLNGAIEVRASATGYVQSTWALAREVQYGSRIAENVVATLHQHLFHYKFDLDVAGPSNRFATLDISMESEQHPWFPGRNRTQMRYDHKLKMREMDAVVLSNSSQPRYLLVYSEESKNKWGMRRAYRIQNLSPSPFLLHDVPSTRAASWANYATAVTKFDNTQDTSTSIYAQNEPWEPVLDFQSFLADNAGIVDEDLVVWVTTGVHHIPHAEDVPSTTVPGSQLTVLLRPFNFFNECPSVGVSDAVHITRSKDGGKSVDTYGTEQSYRCFHPGVPLDQYDGSRPQV